jgi:hypothetical protein
MEAADLQKAFEIFPASNTEDYHSIYQLAEQIIPGFYADHIDAAHLQFFVQRFHAPEEIERQIVQGNLATCWSRNLDRWQWIGNIYRCE